MPRTPDRRAGSRYEEKLILEQTDSLGQPVVDPPEQGGQTYHDGAFALRDAIGVFDPRTGGSGLSEFQHKRLRHLIHFIDNGPADGFASGAFRELLPAGSPFPTSVIWWESTSKSEKIVEKTITRSGGVATNTTPTPVVWEMYDTDGVTVLATVTDTITYQGVFELSRVREIKVLATLSASLGVNVS